MNDEVTRVPNNTNGYDYKSIMNDSHNAVELMEQLEESVKHSGNDYQNQRDILVQLAKVNVSISLLRESKVGKRLRQMCKLVHKKNESLAKSTLNAWKKSVGSRKAVSSTSTSRKKRKILNIVDSSAPSSGKPTSTTARVFAPSSRKLADFGIDMSRHALVGVPSLEQICCDKLANFLRHNVIVIEQLPERIAFEVVKYMGASNLRKLEELNPWIRECTDEKWKLLFGKRFRDVACGDDSTMWRERYAIAEEKEARKMAEAGKRIASRLESDARQKQLRAVKAMSPDPRSKRRRTNGNLKGIGSKSSKSHVRQLLATSRLNAKRQTLALKMQNAKGFDKKVLAHKLRRAGNEK